MHEKWELHVDGRLKVPYLHLFQDRMRSPWDTQHFVPTPHFEPVNPVEHARPKAQVSEAYRNMENITFSVRISFTLVARLVCRYIDPKTSQLDI